MLSQPFDGMLRPSDLQATSTAIRSEPRLLSWSVRELGARRTARAGDTVSATEPALTVSAETGVVAAMATAAANARLTVRWR